MPPPAGYVPVARTGLAVDQGKHILPEKNIYTLKKVVLYWLNLLPGLGQVFYNFNCK